MYPSRPLGGADEIWFNPGDNKVYLRGTAPAGIGIMDASSNHAFSLVAVPGAQGLHSIAVNANNNRVFLPNSDNPDNGAGGIAMLQAKAKPNRRADN